MGRDRTFMLHSIGSSCENSKWCIACGGLKRAIVKNKTGHFTFDDGYMNILGCGEEIFSLLGERAAIFLVAGKVGSLNDWDTTGELIGKPLLDWGQIRELKKLGVRIGSHSLSHADLTKLGDRELERETRESKKILEEKIGEPVEGFSYPYGYFNERVIDAVKDAGYRWAMTTSDSIWEGWGNPYRLRRINISGLDPDWLLRAKLSGFYDIKAVWELPALAWDKLTLPLWAFGKTG